MPITPFLNGQAFEPETINNMSVAFMSVCDRLWLTDRNDRLTEVVAKKIIELTQRGVRDSGTLCKRALQELDIDE